MQDFIMEQVMSWALFMEHYLRLGLDFSKDYLPESTVSTLQSLLDDRVCMNRSEGEAFFFRTAIQTIVTFGSLCTTMFFICYAHIFWKYLRGNTDGHLEGCKSCEGCCSLQEENNPEPKAGIVEGAAEDAELPLESDA